MKKLFPLILCYLFLFTAQAQQNNQAFFKASLDTLPLYQLSLRTNVLGYFKSNEYFNKIVEGYTLPGFQLWPSVHYRIQEHLTVEAGVWLQKDFGSPGLRRAEPTLSLRLHDKHRRFIFGTLDGTVEHNLLEPLMDFERVLNERLENGMQLVLDYPRWKLDVWTDWMKYIFPADSAQEEFFGGIKGHYDIVKKGNYRLRVPASLMFFHKGGQIDALPDPVFTMTHASLGLENDWTFANPHLKSFTLSGHYLYYFEWNNPVNVYPQGNGWYFNASVSGKWGTLMASYWRGHQFLTAIGGRLYRSQSSDWERPQYVEPQRELLILRIMNEFNIGDYRIMLRTEPHYDIKNKQFEYALATYVHFDPHFLLANLKHH